MCVQRRGRCVDSILFSWLHENNMERVYDIYIYIYIITQHFARPGFCISLSLSYIQVFVHAHPYQHVLTCKSTLVPFPLSFHQRRVRIARAHNMERKVHLSNQALHVPQQRIQVIVDQLARDLRDRKRRISWLGDVSQAQQIRIYLIQPLRQAPWLWRHEVRWQGSPSDQAAGDHGQETGDFLVRARELAGDLTQVFEPPVLLAVWKVVFVGASGIAHERHVIDQARWKSTLAVVGMGVGVANCCTVRMMRL